MNPGEGLSETLIVISGKSSGKSSIAERISESFLTFISFFVIPLYPNLSLRFEIFSSIILSLILNENLIEGNSLPFFVFTSLKNCT